MAGNYWQPRNIGSFSWSNSLPLCLFLRSTKSWPENPLPISFSRWCSVARFCSILLFKAYTKLWNYVLLHGVVNFVNQKCLGITFGTHLYQYVIKYNMYFAPYFPKTYQHFYIFEYDCLILNYFGSTGGDGWWQSALLMVRKVQMQRRHRIYELPYIPTCTCSWGFKIQGAVTGS